MYKKRRNSLSSALFKPGQTKQAVAPESAQASAMKRKSKIDHRLEVAEGTFGKSGKRTFMNKTDDAQRWDLLVELRAVNIGLNRTEKSIKSDKRKNYSEAEMKQYSGMVSQAMRRFIAIAYCNGNPKVNADRLWYFPMTGNLRLLLNAFEQCELQDSRGVIYDLIKKSGVDVKKEFATALKLVKYEIFKQLRTVCNGENGKVTAKTACKQIGSELSAKVFFVQDPEDFDLKTDFIQAVLLKLDYVGAIVDFGSKYNIHDTEWVCKNGATILERWMQFDLGSTWTKYFEQMKKVIHRTRQQKVSFTLPDTQILDEEESSSEDLLAFLEDEVRNAPKKKSNKKKTWSFEEDSEETEELQDKKSSKTSSKSPPKKPVKRVSFVSESVPSLPPPSTKVRPRSPETPKKKSRPQLPKKRRLPTSVDTPRKRAKAEENELPELEPLEM